MQTINIGLVDDHQLITQALSEMINNFDGYRVVLKANNGEDLIEKLKTATDEINIMLIDVNMPIMNGFETAKWLTENKPLINLIALSMNDDDLSLIKMMRNGCKGYLLKDSTNTELQKAMEEVMTKGYFYNEFVTGKLIHNLNKNEDALINPVKLSDRETEFLKMACTEMTYKEIASKMFLSERTIDGYRDSLFDKLNIKTRVGLVIYAIKQGLFRV